MVVGRRHEINSLHCLTASPPSLTHS